MATVKQDKRYKVVFLGYSPLGADIGSGKEEGIEDLTIEYRDANNLRKYVQGEVKIKDLSGLERFFHSHTGLEIEFELVDGRYRFNF